MVHRMLWDRFPELPYHAHAPWPRVIYNGNQDWEASVALVDSWLMQYIGRRWVDWTWGLTTFNMGIDADQCLVNFRSQQYTTLFLLKFSDCT